MTKATALTLAMSIVLLGCGGDGRQAEPAAEVQVSIPPLAWFVERIAGADEPVGVVVGEGQNPHTFEPTPRQVVELGRAKLLLTVDMPFEEQIVDKLASADDGPRIVDVGEGLRHMAHGSHDHHDHGHDHADHDRGEHLDPHVWMSPRLAKTIAERIAAELTALRPEKTDAYRRNLESVLADLDAVDKRLAERLAPLKGRTFFVFHPAFGYFAEAYALEQEAVEIEGKSPGPKHVKRLVDRARAEGVKVIFVQEQFSRETARSIAEQIDGTVIPLDPLARDYLANLNTIADRIESALAPKTQSADGLRR